MVCKVCIFMDYNLQNLKLLKSDLKKLAAFIRAQAF